MAFKVSFELQLSPKLVAALKEAGKPIDDATAKKVGIEVTKEMKTLIAKGISPIEGSGKFPRYKNPQKYPGDRKAKSPVNLKLLGDFLNALTYRVKAGPFGKITEIFYGNNQSIKEEGHRKGTGGQPERPTLPSEKGEDFTRTIKEIYTEAYKARILEVLKNK
jgi:hypothetical protein